MIKFIYNEHIEKNVIFDKYVLPRKREELSSLILSEIDIVKIDNNSEFIKSLIAHIQSEWEKVSENFYERLGAFYGITIQEPNITCYLTRLTIFPYYYNKEKESEWFAAPLFGNPAERIHVVMHELCHYFQPIELPRDIKEAIPVILNDNDTFKMYAVDRGHGTAEENKWREIIWDIYKKGGTFADVLNIVNTKQVE